MVRGVNKAILIGNLGNDPETRYTQSGDPITTFRLATNRSWRDRNTNETRTETDWHSVVCFGSLAELANTYLKKGSACYIEGEIRTRSWEREGQRMYRTEINARSMVLLSGDGGREDSMDPESRSRRTSGDSGAQRGPERRRERPQSSQFNEPNEDITEDDIPF